MSATILTHKPRYLKQAFASNIAAADDQTKTIIEQRPGYQVELVNMRITIHAVTGTMGAGDINVHVGDSTETDNHLIAKEDAHQGGHLGAHEYNFPGLNLNEIADHVGIDTDHSLLSATATRSTGAVYPNATVTVLYYEYPDDLVGE